MVRVGVRVRAALRERAPFGLLAEDELARPLHLGGVGVRVGVMVGFGFGSGVGVRVSVRVGVGVRVGVEVGVGVGARAGVRASGPERCACRGSSWAGGGSAPLAALAALAAWQGEYFLVVARYKEEVGHARVRAR